MKEIKLYQCEYCNTQYKNRSECESCEDNHIVPVKIVSAGYHASRLKRNYPDAIIVEMDDGNKIMYETETD